MSEGRRKEVQGRVETVCPCPSVVLRLGDRPIRCIQLLSSELLFLGQGPPTLWADLLTSLR